MGPFVILGFAMKRVIAYVDGFNFYAGISEFVKKHPNALAHNKIDLSRLIEHHLLHEGESLEAVKWYSAIPPVNRHDPIQKAKIDRHHDYRRDLEATQVLTRISGFKKRITKCKSCGKTTKSQQEKESDKRCSLEMLEDAFYDRMDRALLFSSDSDFVPALYSLHRYSSHRPIDVVMCPPLGRESPAKTVLNTCSNLFATKPRYTRRKALANSLFTV